MFRSIWPDPQQQVTPRETALPETADEVVVGAGLTGLVTALLLARAGRRVVVLEARELGAVTTGHSTAKVSLMQGTRLSTVLSHHSEKVGRAYVEANREGQAWLRRFCEDHGVAVEERPASTFAGELGERASVESEHRAATRLGLDVQWREDLDVPFPVHGATVLQGQLQVDPRAVVGALADEVRRHGGEIHVGRRATGLRTRSDGAVVQVDDGGEQRVEVRCERVVVATGIPVFDRGLYFAKVEPRRSYTLALAGTTPPEAMLLSAGSSSRSVRDAHVNGEHLLLLGGAGHTVGRVASEAEHVEALRHWAATWYPGARELAQWSAQDYSTHDGVPFVGVMPRSRGRAYLATGFGAWGMTNGPAAALALAGELLGAEKRWSRTLGRRISGPRSAMEIARINLGVGLEGVKGLARVVGGPQPRPDASPADDEQRRTGHVGRSGLCPVAVVPDDSEAPGTGTALDARCTHLGGIVRWNEVEQSWDCPWHGSRFSPEGDVLEGPATRPLRRVDADDR